MVDLPYHCAYGFGNFTSMANALFTLLATGKQIFLLLFCLALLLQQTAFAQLTGKERKNLNIEVESLCQNTSNGDEIIGISNRFFENGQYKYFKHYECFFSTLKNKGLVNEFHTVWNQVFQQQWFIKKHHDACLPILQHYYAYGDEALEATEAMRNKDLNSALEHLDNCERINPNISHAIENKALVLHYLKRYPESIVYARKAYHTKTLDFKRRSQFQHIMASCHLELGELDSAYKYAVPAQTALKYIA